MIIKILVVLLCFTFLIQAEEAPKPQKTQIVDANHFYSEQNKQKTYKITQLEKGKPIAIVIKPSEAGSYSNSITLTITSGSKKKQCLYASYQDICVMDSIETQEGTLGIKCESLPCDVTWKIYQPKINKLQNSQKVQGLYQIPKDANRLIVSIYCKSIGEQQTENDNIATPYSNMPFQTLRVSSTNQYVAFEQVKQGYLYFSVGKKYKSCATIKFTKGPKTISKQLVNDFVKGDKKVVYDLTDVPNGKDFRFDLSFHHPLAVQEDKSVTLSITGSKNGDRKTIRENKVEINPSYQSLDMSLVIPKIDTSQWKDIRLEIETKASLFLTEILQQQAERIEVEATEFSYFDLKKGEKLNYKLVPEPKGEKKKDLTITPSDSKLIKTTKDKCNMQEGCDFEVEAVDDVRGYIYIGFGSGAAKQIPMLDFGNSFSFTHKIKQLESIYIKKKFELKKAIQVTINSPNVLVYLASTKICPTPSQACYEKIGNINRHFIYYPDKEDQLEGIFLVKALDTCEFTLTLIPEDSQFVKLKDSQPFVYMFDKEEKSLKFKFKREEKVDVNFNLIAPLHALDLIVENGKKLPEDEQATISTEGYLQFKAENAPKSEFTILVRKREGYEDKYIHFTLIASTKGKQIRLQSGITHYETLPADSDNNAEYIFQFQPSEQYILNFYSHNTKQQNVNIKLYLRPLGQKSQKVEETKLVIDKSSDVLNLNDVSSFLCSKVDDNDDCEIAMRLQNSMEIQVDIAITLMSHHTIIQLKDGIWQSYSLNSIAKTTHFYFFPRHKDQDVGIMYKTTDPAVRLKYRIFYAFGDLISPSDWPFPSETLNQEQRKQQTKFKPINHINIGKSTLDQCWPDCAVLISLIDLQHKDTSGSFSIMASNSIMEIPEKQKIDITLKQGQSKAYLVDLKYALSIEQNIFFYIYHSIGLTQIFANIYSEKNDRVPDQQNFDYQLNSHEEMKIPFSGIKQIIKREEMDDHINIYLYIVVEALSDSKLSIQFTFNQIDQPNEKLISLDTFQHVTLTQRDSRIFYTPIDQPYEVKVSRQNGFPFYTSQVCKKELDSCLQQMRDQKSKGTQILTKVAAYTAQPCQKCYYIFKISTQDDPSQVNVHLQSKTSQVQLFENKPVYDFTEKDESNKYVLYAIKGQEVNLNVHVSQGEVDVSLTDLGAIRQSKSGKKIVSFKIPTRTNDNQKKLEPVKLSAEEKEKLQKQQKSMQQISILKKQNPMLTQTIMSAFGLSDKFVQMHVQVKSKDPQKPSIYTISYSSGDLEFQLQDGLITDYNLEPNKQAVFYYSSRNAGHVYFTASMEKSQYLKDLDVVMKFCNPKNNIIDDDCWVEYEVSKPAIKDKTPNPTIMYSLLDKNYLSITLTYKGKKTQKVSLGINHQQIMILPFGVEFPFILHGGEKISFLVELSNPGYIQIITRKCDESNPTFSYTFDYDSFQKDQFTYETQLADNPKNRFMTKVKPGTLYMRMKTPEKQQSLVSIMVHYSEQKFKDTEMVAGNKGNVEYSIIDSASAQLTIKPPTCSGTEKCEAKLKYYIMTANKMRDLYSQLVCPSNFFSNRQFLSGDPINQEEVQPRQNADESLTIQFKLLDQISYVGIKATNNKGKQVFYKPLEVATLWGHLSRTSSSHKLAITSIFIFLILSIVICVRRNARRGYKPIQDQV